jgi:hypothetical protein
METIYILEHVQYMLKVIIDHQQYCLFKAMEGGRGWIINFVRYKFCNYKLCYV